jgi:hypothetical protein
MSRFDADEETEESNDQEAQPNHRPPPAVEVELGVNRSRAPGLDRGMSDVAHVWLPPDDRRKT